MPTLTSMIAEIKREGDLGDSVADADITSVLNEELADLFELMVNSFDDYQITSSQVTIDADTDSKALPATIYKIRGVEDDANDDWPLPRFNWEERKRVTRLSYAVLGNNLIVRPKQAENRVYNVFFVPQFTALAAGGDTFTAPNQWHMVAVLQAAARFQDMAERDSSALTGRAERVRQRIVQAAAQRDAGDPGKARDVRGRRDQRLQTALHDWEDP